MLAMDTMRRCSNLPVLLALLLAVCPIALRGQAAPGSSSAPAAQQAPSPAQPSVETAPTVAETQPSLDVDRDPILSPDPKDNLPVSPEHPNPGQTVHTEHGVYTLRRDVDEVVLNCTVIDDKGHLAEDLSRNDFRVFENNAPQTIVSFEHSDLPVSIGIIVDNSGSMRDKRDKVNQAVLNLIRDINPQDQIFVVNFSRNSYLDQDFTSDINLLDRALKQVSTQGSTALYDTIVASAVHLNNNTKFDKKVLLVITDGQDNMSQQTLQEATRRLQQNNGPTLYAIGLMGEGPRAPGRPALQSLADATGGAAFFPDTLDQVDTVSRDIARDIRNQYAIAYKPRNPEAKHPYQSIRVEARAPGYGRLTVHTRTGLYGSQSGQSAN